MTEPRDIAFEPGDLSSQLVIQASTIMVTLNADGTVEFGPSYHPDAMAAAVWTDLAERNPLLPRVQALEAEQRVISARLRAYAEAARDLLADDDPAGILADDAAYQRWRRNRDVLTILVKGGPCA